MKMFYGPVRPADRAECPAFGDIPKINEMRRNQAPMAASAELNPVFEIWNTPEPVGLSQMKRADWANGPISMELRKEDEYPLVDLPVPLMIEQACRHRDGWYPESRRISPSSVPKKCGIRPQVGNEYLSNRWLNMEIFKRYGIKKVITQCPHCYNTLSNEYPQFGGNYEVTHHTEFISRLIGMGRIRMKGEKGGTITYQDPCYLGRHNGIYRSPRDILNVSGYRLAEMRGSSQESFCCGAGGGRIWMEECLGERINVKRTEDALAVNPESIVTACPYCLTMMEDGVKLKNMNERWGPMGCRAVVEAIDKTSMINRLHGLFSLRHNVVRLIPSPGGLVCRSRNNFSTARPLLAYDQQTGIDSCCWRCSLYFGRYV
jgi:hypothetical protein